MSELTSGWLVSAGGSDRPGLTYCSKIGGECCKGGGSCQPGDKCVLYNGQPYCCLGGVCTRTDTSSFSESLEVNAGMETATNPTSPTESDPPISCEANLITVFDPVVTSVYIVKTDCDCPAIVGEASGTTTSESSRFGFNCTIPVSTTSTVESPQNLAITNGPSVPGTVSSSSGRMSEGRMGRVAFSMCIIAGAIVGMLIVNGH
jgi:hypothetical protein